MQTRDTKNISRSFALTVIAIAALATSACSHTINATAKMAAEVQSRKFELSINRVEGFMDCIETPGGMCPTFDIGDTAPEPIGFFNGRPYESSSAAVFSAAVDNPVDDTSDVPLTNAQRANQVAADLAREVLKHDVQRQLDGLFNTVKGAAPATIYSDLDDSKTIFKVNQSPSGDKEATMNLTLESFQKYQEDIEAATLLGGWDALAAEIDLFDVVDADQARRKAYIKHYFDAYFRAGKFFQATIDGTKLKQKVVERLQQTIPGLEEQDARELALKLFPQYKFNAGETKYVFGSIEDAGFVTRGGQRVAFPAITASFALGSSDKEITKVDYIAVGSDLIRVLLHAVYDADLRVPAVEDATGISVPIDPLMINDPSRTNVDEHNFGRVQSRASQVEGVVSAGTGRLVRGISFLSLNNEAIATAIETAVGLAVRKQVEKVVWCWYACKFDEPNDHGDVVGDFAALSYGDKIELTINISGFSENYGLKGVATPN